MHLRHRSSTDLTLPEGLAGRWTLSRESQTYGTNEVAEGRKPIFTQSHTYTLTHARPPGLNSFATPLPCQGVRAPGERSEQRKSTSFMSETGPQPSPLPRQWWGTKG